MYEHAYCISIIRQTLQTTHILHTHYFTLKFGDLSVQIDKRVKESVASFCGKDKYEVSKVVFNKASYVMLNISNTFHINISLAI